MGNFGHHAAHGGIVLYLFYLAYLAQAKRSNDLALFWASADTTAYKFYLYHGMHLHAEKLLSGSRKSFAAYIAHIIGATQGGEPGHGSPEHVMRVVGADGF
jgi:hypothetical protein